MTEENMLWTVLRNYEIAHNLTKAMAQIDAVKNSHQTIAGWVKLSPSEKQEKERFEAWKQLIVDT